MLCPVLLVGKIIIQNEYEGSAKAGTQLLKHRKNHSTSMHGHLLAFKIRSGQKLNIIKIPFPPQ